MIWALLAFLGIPIWFIGVLLVAVFRNRHQVRARPDVFRFVEATDDGWARRVGYARWVSDVLIVHKGPALVGTDARQVLGTEVSGTIADPPKKLDDAVAVTWTFADAEARPAAVDSADAERAAGPRPRSD